jgi:hypothetical protein
MHRSETYASRCEEFCHAFFAIGLKTRFARSSLPDTRLRGLSGRLLLLLLPSLVDELGSGSLAFFRLSERFTK